MFWLRRTKNICCCYSWYQHKLLQSFHKQMTAHLMIQWLNEPLNLDWSPQNGWNIAGVAFSHNHSFIHLILIGVENHFMEMTLSLSRYIDVVHGEPEGGVRGNSRSQQEGTRRCALANTISLMKTLWARLTHPAYYHVLHACQHPQSSHSSTNLCNYTVKLPICSQFTTAQMNTGYTLAISTSSARGVKEHKNFKSTTDKFCEYFHLEPRQRIYSIWAHHILVRNPTLMCS